MKDIIIWNDWPWAGCIRFNLQSLNIKDVIIWNDWPWEGCIRCRHPEADRGVHTRPSETVDSVAMRRLQNSNRPIHIRSYILSTNKQANGSLYYVLCNSFLLLIKKLCTKRLSCSRLFGKWLLVKRLFEKWLLDISTTWDRYDVWTTIKFKYLQ